MESVRSEADRAEAYDGPSSDAVWGVTGIMVKDILPDRLADRRKRSRLCALRAMDRLGMLGEENLIPTLTRRPDLRWLADEQRARWALLTELGRIGEPDAFEEAVEWALENRPRFEEARAYIRRFRLHSHRPSGTRRVGKRAAAKRASPSSLDPCGVTETRRQRPAPAPVPLRAESSSVPLVSSDQLVFEPRTERAGKGGRRKRET